MLWTSNICRICARISEICIPIFEEDATPCVEAKIRRCLNASLSKDDLKPKQVCQDCFIKLTEFYNFVALFHESNYRFETLLYQSTQGTAEGLQGCAGQRSTSLGLTEGGGTGVVPTKTEDLADCSNLGLMIEYKDDMLPLENLDVQARDFADQNILNEIVEQAAVNTSVNIDVQNFVNTGDNQIFTGASSNISAVKNPSFGKLRNQFLSIQEVEVLIPNAGFIKEESESYLPNTQTNSDVKLKNNNEKKNSKLSIISVETIQKPIENEKVVKNQPSKVKKVSNSNNNNNSMYKTQDFGDPNILNDIANQTSEVDIDNIDVQNLVTTSEIIRNPSMDKIDTIRRVYLDLDQNVQESAGVINNCDQNKGCGEPLAGNDGFYKENVNEAKADKKRNKLNLISVTTICKMMAKRPQIEIIPRRRHGRYKDVIPLKARLEEKLQTTKMKRFTCSYCKKAFGRRQHMNEHMKKHESSRPYTCDVCGKTFAVQWDLTSHKRVHTDLYSCQHCGKCFSAPSKLERHVRIHTGERPFVCAIKDCGRSFSDKRNLIGHQITHTNIRRFTCDICKRSYKTKSQLKDHMQAHSENPAFRCEVCNKSYKWKTNLLIHMKKHTNQVCSKSSLLSKHKRECKVEIPS